MTGDDQIDVAPEGRPDLPESPAVARRGRRRWTVAGLGLLAVLGGAAAALWSWRPWSGPGSPMAEVASRTTPAIATLLLEAERVARQLVERFPESAEAANVMGQLLYRFGKSEEAVEWWERCIQLDADFVPAYDAMGTVALENGENERAARLFRQAMARDPESSAIPVRLAEVLISQGELEEAVAVLEKNLERHPRSLPSLALLGQACVQRKEYAKARAALEMAIQIGPDYTNAYYGLATACARLGDQQQSKVYMEKFQALKKRDERSHRDELKILDDAATVRRTVAQVYTNAGMVYLAHNDPETGEAHLRRAIALVPDHAPSREVLAWLYHRQGRTEEALATLAELVARAPEDLSAQMTAGSLYSEMRRFTEAERAYRKAIELTPRLGGPYAALANLYLEHGRRLADAKGLALQAVTLEPAAKYYYVLSVACLRTGDRPGAMRAITQALAADPENGDYQKLRDLMEGSQEDAQPAVGP